MLSVGLLQARQGVSHRCIGQGLQRIKQFSDSSIAIIGVLPYHTRSCTASRNDTQVGIIQLCNAMQPTDEWAFFSHIGFKGPVTKAELCRCFETGELQGELFIHHCSEDCTSGKELKDWYEQWGPHMPRVQPTCMHVGMHASVAVDHALSHVLSIWPSTLTVFPAWQLYAELCMPAHTALCPAQLLPLCHIYG